MIEYEFEVRGPYDVTVSYGKAQWEGGPTSPPKLRGKVLDREMFRKWVDRQYGPYGHHVLFESICPSDMYHILITAQYLETLTFTMTKGRVMPLRPPPEGAVY